MHYSLLVKLILWKIRKCKITDSEFVAQIILCKISLLIFSVVLFYRVLTEINKFKEFKMADPRYGYKNGKSDSNKTRVCLCYFNPS